MKNSNSQELVIRSRRGWWDIDFAEIWRYRDLLVLFVRRDFVTFYKQTILGPVWYILQPLLTSTVFTIVFGAMARLPTDGVPPFLFYLAGSVSWSYFSGSLEKTSNTFVRNAGMFGKVYFPRMVVPIATVIVNLAQFAIQMILFLAAYAYFAVNGTLQLPSFPGLFWLPLLVLQMAILSLAVGILISAVTTKYRDLTFALGFGLQLWMYASPVVYPASMIPEKHRALYMLNPVAPIMEQFRAVFFGAGVVTMEQVAVGWAGTIVLMVSGLILFHRVEKNFMDTV